MKFDPAADSPEASENAAADRAVLRARAAALRERHIEFIPSDDFSHPTADDVILNGPAPAAPRARRVQVPAGLPSYMAALYAVPLLNPAQEVYEFRRFNYLKYKAAELQPQVNPARPSRTRLELVERWLIEAEQVRNRIVQANLRLVVANARIFANREHVFEDLVSDGNLSLVQAVEKFDYSRGFRFSTYATHAIRRTFYRRMARKQKEKTRLIFTGPEILHEAPQQVMLESAEPATLALYQAIVRRMGECLSEREQVILRARYSLEDDASAPTLQSLAKDLGICKERVRQLQNRAVDKLRVLAEDIQIQLDTLPTPLLDSTEDLPGLHEGTVSGKSGLALT